MKYLIYKVTNTINDKFFIGKFIGPNEKFKITHSSNKYLLNDIKKYKSKNFKKEILKRFESKKDLLQKYNKIVDKDFKLRDDTYNYIYKISDKGKQNISIGRLKKESEKLKNKYNNFSHKHKLQRYDKRFYKIKNFCKHGDLTILISDFNKIYKDNNKFYCQKCAEEYLIEHPLSLDEVLLNINKIQSIIKYPSSNRKTYIKRIYPIVYNSILRWSDKYKNLSFQERLFLAKNKLKNKPKCLCCNNDAKFSSSHVMYGLYCDDHIKNHHTSNKENDLYKFIEGEYTGEIKQNYSINGYEIDIFIPEFSLGIEFNGLYWHSSIYKDKTYHYNKWKLCEDNNIQLVFIWEDDWDYKQEIVKSIILNLLKLSKNKIYARSCKIKTVNKNITKEFLDKNHIQGNCISSINLGLYYNEELVSLMTFGKRNISNKSSYELIRFCSKLNINVVGGASKLFKFFISNFKDSYEEIISYASCDISRGNLYKILGFKYIGHTGINYWWATDRRYHRSNFMKFKLNKNKEYSGLTEDEIMTSKKYLKIYGAGNLKYVWKKENMLN